MNSFIAGWQYNEDRILASTARIESAGIQFSYSADRPHMKGHWKRKVAFGFTRVAAQDDELKLKGFWRDPNSQLRGTCVGQGSSRAIEDVQISRLIDRVIIGDRLVQIAYEIMYGYERKLHWSPTHPWGCNCHKCPDGLQGADAAAFYSTVGCLPRKNYLIPRIDLSRPREDLAIQWSNSGVPQWLIDEAASHKIICHTSPTWEEYADPIAAKCWGHVCLPMIFTGDRVDKYGCCEPSGPGGHDTECCGVILLPSGETAFVMQQSWGSACKYPPIVQTASGPLTMRPGSYVVRQSVLESLGHQVERISCDIPEGASFR